jgi:hypothetical protein
MTVFSKMARQDLTRFSAFFRDCESEWRNYSGVRPVIVVPIKGDDGSISIEVVGYENATAGNDSDANWLTCRIEISAGPFRGQFDASLTTQDFADFRRQLDEVLQILKGKAVFQTHEDWLCLEIVMGTRGTAKVGGVAKISGGSKTSLSFTFETDQSYLAQTKNALDLMVRDFPVQQGLKPKKGKQRPNAARRNSWGGSRA